MASEESGLFDTSNSENENEIDGSGQRLRKSSTSAKVSETWKERQLSAFNIHSRQQLLGESLPSGPTLLRLLLQKLADNIQLSLRPKPHPLPPLSFRPQLSDQMETLLRVPASRGRVIVVASGIPFKYMKQVSNNNLLVAAIQRDDDAKRGRICFVCSKEIKRSAHYCHGYVSARGEFNACKAPRHPGCTEHRCARCSSLNVSTDNRVIGSFKYKGGPKFPSISGDGRRIITTVLN